MMQNVKFALSLALVGGLLFVGYMEWEKSKRKVRVFEHTKLDGRERRVKEAEARGETAYYTEEEMKAREEERAKQAAETGSVRVRVPRVRFGRR